MSDTALERGAAPVPGGRISRLKPKRLAVAGLAILAGLGAAEYGQRWWTVGRFIETTDDAYAGGDVTAVSPHVAGFVGEILVADNQHVEAGQVLLRLDARDYRAALDRAEAVAEEKQAALAGLEARYAM
jgi:membrane fusion protein (multidrug efflux system)